MTASSTHIQVHIPWDASNNALLVNIDPVRPRRYEPLSKRSHVAKPGL